MSKVSLKDRARYWFDNFMTKGRLALLAGLAVLSAVMIFAIAAMVVLTNSAPEMGDGSRAGFLTLAWMSSSATTSSTFHSATCSTWPTWPR